MNYENFKKLQKNENRIKEEIKAIEKVLAERNYYSDGAVGNGWGEHFPQQYRNAVADVFYKERNRLFDELNLLQKTEL